jgi:enamine deaminase RidA (YjgF/YER057c/UK114 family)
VTVEYKILETLPTPIGLYSHVARAGNLAFFAGVTAMDAEGRVIGKGDLEGQMLAAYSEMGQALKAEGLSYSNIVHMTTYLVREQDIPEYYRVRARVYQELYPEGKFPPTVLVVVSRLVDPDFLIEIQFVAAD